MVQTHLYLEHDGKVLLVDEDGNGPMIPVMGREDSNEDILRLPSKDEAEALGLTWSERRRNRMKLGEEWHEVIHAEPNITWPEDWAWKDHLVSDSSVAPIARESTYRTMHRLVSKVVMRDPLGRILLQKVKRGFFTGQWTLPGGFVNYGEHPKTGAERELAEELGIDLRIPDPLGETEHGEGGVDHHLMQERIFTMEGIDFVCITYLLDVKEGLVFSFKDDEVEDAQWFDYEDAFDLAVSPFDSEAIKRLGVL